MGVQADAGDQLAAALASQGLPDWAPLNRLIEHHRANAALAATFNGIVEGRRMGNAEFSERVLEAGVDHTSTCDARTGMNDSGCTCGLAVLQSATEEPSD